MDVVSVLQVLARRWLVIVPVMLVSLVLAVVIQGSAQSQYTADGFVVLDSRAASVTRDTPTDFDPVAISREVDFDDDRSRDVTVRLLGGSNYLVEARAESPELAAEDATTFLELLRGRIAANQLADDVPTTELLELRQISASVVTEPLEDGRWSAGVTAFLSNPVDGGDNPYQPNAATGRLLEVAATGDQGRVHVADRVGDVDYTVTQTARDAAPLLRIVTFGTDPERVIETFFVVHELLAAELDLRQDEADVSAEDRITVEIVDAPVGVFDQSPPVDRAAFGVIVLGAGLALGLALVVESISQRRQRRTEQMLAVLGRDGADEAASRPVEREVARR